ncbi:DUF3347 domain-containing protein [Pseudenhygromyxa sp. WMMC2535]|uniref:DUF3347 domain-containing protein n=1 Tax=Pseudenhygromyxa sp. WMMC2535 TaxID=2712867 RepID=UPI0015518220|nr:DUF3347 domain-containing protein [Pseudenhygromyxa sp. WMMC2535]NVB36634.1 DUF3347 domain-containing protein [Pseudenhygromyxa sp. WMMC2535]
MATWTRRRWLTTALAGACWACKGKREEDEASPEVRYESVLACYLGIGEILAGDSIEGVSQAGASLVVLAGLEPTDAGLDELLAGVQRLGSPDIATVRMAYRKMSEGMIAWLAANPGEREGLELIFCPMTFTNEGAYWVQRAGKIENPYEGAMMLRCGAKLDWSDYRRGAPPAGEVAVEGMEAGQ